MKGIRQASCLMLLALCCLAHGLPSPDNTTEPTTTDPWTCPMISLNPGEYILFPNKTAYVEAYNQIYQHYILSGDKLLVCANYSIEDVYEEIYEEDSTDDFMKYTTTIGISISIACLCIHMILFIMIREMRTFQVCNLTSLCFCLIIAYSLFLCIDSYEKSPSACHVIAVLMHYFYLASFFWSNVISVDVLRTLISLKYYSSTTLKQRYIAYSFYAWAGALAISLAAVIFNYTDLGPAYLKPEFATPLCWFQNKTALLYLFGVPIMIVLVINFACFIASISIIFFKKMKTTDKRDISLKNEVAVYLRLALIMGFAWVFGIIASYSQMKVFWYLYVIFTTFHGMFIFLSFTCFNRAVKKNLKRIFCRSNEYDVDSSISIVLHNR